MQITVIGGSGFLGSHISDALTRKGYKVKIFDKKKSKWKRADQILIKGNISDYKSLDKAIKGADIVYNFAALSDIDQARHEPLSCAKVNILGTVQALNLCHKYKVRRFIQASSIYATSSQGGFYSCSKRAAEDYLVEFNKSYKLNYTILRFGSVYGPRSDKNNGIRIILERAISQRKIIYMGNKKAVRKYINVFDAAKACVEILKSRYENKCVVLTGQKSIKISELLKFLAKILNINSKIIFKDEKGNTGHYIKTPNLYEAKKGRGLLLRSRINFHDGLLSLIQDIKKN